jgi:hypothetical protein
MKLFKVPTNTARMASIVGVKAARAAARTHTAVKPATSGAMALMRRFHPSNLPKG